MSSCALSCPPPHPNIASGSELGSHPQATVVGRPPCSLHPARLPSWGLEGRKELGPQTEAGLCQGQEWGGGFSCPCLLSDHVTEAHLVPGANPVLHWEGVSGCLFEELL